MKRRTVKVDASVAAARKLIGSAAVRRSSSHRNAQRDRVMKLIFSKPGLAKVVADQLGVTHQNVAAWNQVPAKHVMAVASLIDMTPEEIRSDIFDPNKRR